MTARKRAPAKAPPGKGGAAPVPKPAPKPSPKPVASAPAVPPAPPFPPAEDGGPARKVVRSTQLERHRNVTWSSPAKPREA